jgi:peptidoglycan/xylan/chitin deacetylase (PgdA/CDA1 family)
MKATILCYHSCHAGSDYATDDHIALAADLRTIHRLGFRVVPLDWIVDMLLGQRDPIRRSVALTCDDGVDLDWIDADHPTFGRRRSFANILRDFAAEAGWGDPPVEMTSFVIASSTTRKELEVACLAGLDWWSDAWWREAEASGLMRIENHSYDHVHPLAGRVAQRDQRKGDFTLVDTFDDCEAQVAAASTSIASRSGRLPRYFAYPYGQASDYLRGVYLAERGATLGLRAAFSIEHAYVTLESDRWFLPRFTHGASDTSAPEDLERILVGSDRE